MDPATQLELRRSRQRPLDHALPGATAEKALFEAFRTLGLPPPRIVV